MTLHKFQDVSNAWRLREKVKRKVKQQSTKITQTQICFDQLRLGF